MTFKNSKNSPPHFLVNSAEKPSRILVSTLRIPLTSDLIRGTHNSFARSDPFQSDESRVATADDDVYHFISFAVINDTLPELDGLQLGPINHGHCTDEIFPDKVCSLLRDRISNQFSTGEIRFNLLAVTRDPRIALRQN